MRLGTEQKIAEYLQLDAYKQTLKNEASGYYIEGADYIRSFIEKKEISVEWSECLLYAAEGEALDGMSVDATTPSAEYEDLPMYGMPPTPMDQPVPQAFPPIEADETIHETVVPSAIALASGAPPAPMEDNLPSPTH
ncbi:hypothetical protein NE237_016085 [Protea cynaroides]|uniref:Uncharacterized protein n=1 Tax=Protea cynaroides TaxID=273540 RepID=A0A9Q0KFJ8_9MAGN|nr:hypothetical protein NE237_016085 [Protea cynaroides]